MENNENMSVSEIQMLAKQGDKNALQALYSKVAALDKSGRHDEVVTWNDVVLEKLPTLCFF